jgi:hypothetical protein
VYADEPEVLMVLSARNGQSMRVTQVGRERPHRHRLPPPESWLNWFV